MLRLFGVVFLYSFRHVLFVLMDFLPVQVPTIVGLWTFVMEELVIGHFRHEIMNEIFAA